LARLTGKGFGAGAALRDVLIAELIGIKIINVYRNPCFTSASPGREACPTSAATEANRQPLALKSKCGPRRRSHYALRDVNAAACHVHIRIDVCHAIDQAAMNAHAHSYIGTIL